MASPIPLCCVQWSEGDVWRGCVSLPLDTPISFKYIQVDGSGCLQGWGQDIAGGSNLSVLVTASDEVMSGLELLLEPTDAAGVCTCLCVLATVVWPCKQAPSKHSKPPAQQRTFPWTVCACVHGVCKLWCRPMQQAAASREAVRALTAPCRCFTQRDQSVLTTIH